MKHPGIKLAFKTRLEKTVGSLDFVKITNPYGNSFFDDG